MTPLTPAEQAALRLLAPTREVYGKAPLPIEILAAGGPKALREWLRVHDSSSAPRLRFVPESGDPLLYAESRTSGDVARSVTLAGWGAVPAVAEWLRKGTA